MVPVNFLSRAFGPSRPRLVFMLGPSLLVVPVLQPGGKVRFYLPCGNWFDIWNQTWLQGPGLFELEVPLDQIPIFGREGTILPLGPAVQNTSELKAGLDLEQVWEFGLPREGMQLPGLNLSVSSDGKLENIPSDAKIQVK